MDHARMQAAIKTGRPPIDARAVRAPMKQAGVQARPGQVAAGIDRSRRQWEAGHRPHRTAPNVAHTGRGLTACRDLFDQFDRVERERLTGEQRVAPVRTGIFPGLC